MKLFRYPRFTAAAIFFLASLPVCSQEVLWGSFWCEYEPIVSGVAYPQTDEEAARFVLEEALWVFSGMIYGFTFRYTPSDAARQVEEVFLLEPVHSIPWGDRNLRVVKGAVDREFYRAEIRYYPEDFQRGRLAYWESNTIPSATGTGSGDLFIGREGKYDALSQGVKEAIRGYLRLRSFNKPREVTGEAVLTEVPYVIIDAGGYHARVRVKILVRDIIPYKVY